MDATRMKLELIGVSPLLMHRDAFEDDAEEMATDKGKKGDDRFPPERWKRCLYTDARDGFVVMPATNISACLREGGKKVKAGRASLKAASQSGIFIEEAFPRLLVDGKPIKAKDLLGISGSFEEQQAAAEKLGVVLDVTRVNIMGRRHVRVRPRFDRWSVKFTAKVGADELTPSALKLLWEKAGQVVGLGDWRPGSRQPGPYGRFEVKNGK